MSSSADAIGFHSNFCSSKVLQPSQSIDAEQYAAELGRIVGDHRIDFIVPTEGMVVALKERVASFASLIPTGPDLRRLSRFMSKWNLFQLFLDSNDAALRSGLPPTLLVTPADNLADFVRAHPGPIYAKTDPRPERGLPGRVSRFEDADVALAQIPEILHSYARLVLQSHVPGRGVGVFALRWHGKVRAILMHRRLHEVPHTGGVSSYRETWWHDAIAEDALRRLESMDWWGVGMLEYRWDEATDRFWLMEFNARFWGSLHLALFAGVDFPRLLLEEWSGTTGERVVAPPGVRCRMTFPKEVEYLWSLLKDSSQSRRVKAFALAEFLALSTNPNVHSDLWFPGDRRIYLEGLIETVRKFAR